MFDFEVLVIRLLSHILFIVAYGKGDRDVNLLLRDGRDFVEQKKREAHWSADSGSPFYMRYNLKEKK
jgi:hypothetical protein